MKQLKNQILISNSAAAGCWLVKLPKVAEWIPAPFTCAAPAADVANAILRKNPGCFVTNCSAAV